MINKKNIFLILQNIKPKHKLFLLITLFLAFINGYIETILLKFIQYFFSVLSSSVSKEIIYSNSIFLFALGLLAFLLRSSNDLLSNFNSAAIGNRLLTVSLNNIYKLKLVDLQNISKDLLIVKIQHISKVTGCFFRPIQQIIISSILIIFIFWTSFSIDKILFLYCFGLLLLYYLFIYVISSKYLKYLNNIIGKSHKKLFDYISTSLRTFRTLSLDDSFKYFLKDIYSVDKTLRKNSAIANSVSSIPRYLLDLLLSVLIVISALFFIGLSQSSLALFLGKATVFLVAIQKILPNAQLIYSSIIVIKTNEYALDDLYDLLNLKSTFPERIKILSKNLNPKDLILKFSSKLKDNSKLVDFEIHKDKAVAITGPSGAGKSTILDLLLLIRTDLKATILFNSSCKIFSNEKKEDFKEFWKKSIYCVSQDTLIPGKSIKEVVCGKSKKRFNQKRFINALQLVGLDDLSKENNIDNLDLSIASGDGFLSGGERQRLSIARAIYSEKPILILDEATSNLNRSLALKIIKNLKSLQHIYCIIAVVHDQSILNLFDYEIKLS